LGKAESRNFSIRLLKPTKELLDSIRLEELFCDIKEYAIRLLKDFPKDIGKLEDVLKALKAVLL